MFVCLFVYLVILYSSKCDAGLNLIFEMFCTCKPSKKMCSPSFSDLEYRFCFTGLGVLLECRHRITQCAYPCLSVRDKRKVLIQGNQWFYLISLVRWGGDHDDNENNDDHDNNSRSQA